MVSDQKLTPLDSGIQLRLGLVTQLQQAVDVAEVCSLVKLSAVRLKHSSNSARGCTQLFEKIEVVQGL